MHANEEFDSGIKVSYHFGYIAFFQIEFFTVLGVSTDLRAHCDNLVLSKHPV